MFSKTAQYYDLIYSQFKDYAAEAANIADLVANTHPSARKILDVACGSGEHARLLSDVHGFEVDALDADPAFVAIAASKLGRGRVYEGDMRTFQLPYRYDVVLCLFSSIGYVQSLEAVGETLGRFKDVLAEGGVILIEPWFEPDTFFPGRFSVDVARTEEIAISRVSHSAVEGRLSRLQFEYLIGTSKGIEHLSEEHVLGLFTRAEMLRCFDEASLRVAYDPIGLFNRGMYVARRA